MIASYGPVKWFIALWCVEVASVGNVILIRNGQLITYERYSVHNFDNHKLYL